MWCGLSNERLENSLDKSGHFTAAPELIVEVLSAGDKNQQRDRETKLRNEDLIKAAFADRWVLTSTTLSHRQLPSPNPERSRRVVG